MAKIAAVNKLFSANKVPQVNATKIEEVDDDVQEFVNGDDVAAQ